MTTITIQIDEAPMCLSHELDGRVWRREIVRGLVLRPRKGREEAVRAAIVEAGGRESAAYYHDYVVGDDETIDRIAEAVENDCRARGGVRMALLDAYRASVAHAFPSSIWTWGEAEERGARIDLPVANHTPRVWHYGTSGDRLVGARAHWPSGRRWTSIA